MSSKAVCSDRLLRFEVLEGRMLMSASPTDVETSNTLVGFPPIATSMPIVGGGSNPIISPPGPITQAVAQQPDGKILAAGVDGNNGFEIARYNADGTLDTSFGTDGVTTFDNLNLMVVQQIKIASDGSIYLVGEAAVSGTSADQIADDGGDWWNSPDEITTLIHVEANGSIDTTYGNNGVLWLNDPLTLPSATIQNDGKIVVASENSLGGVQFAEVVNRYNADGTLDTSFNFNQSELPYVGIDPGGPIMVDAQGRIVLTGESAKGFNLMRLNSDGSVDTTFGTSGIQNVPQVGDAGPITVLSGQPDGKILVGTTLRVVRLNADGSPDPTYAGAAGQPNPVMLPLVPGDPTATPPKTVISPPVSVFEPIIVAPVANPDQPVSSPAPPATTASGPAAPPVVMTAQVVTLNVPATTIVTNPSAGPPTVSAQVPTAPTASAVATPSSSGDDASTTTDETQSAELTASPAAIDLAFALAGS